MGLTRGFNAGLVAIVILAVAIVAILAGRNLPYQPGPQATPTASPATTASPAMTTEIPTATAVPTPTPSPTRTPATPTATPIPTQTATATATATATTNNYAVDADDGGFYMNGAPAGSISVARNSKITLTFNVKSTNVYHAGLDFRSTIFNSPSVAPGSSWTTSEITVDNGFTVTSYWPTTVVRKADLQILAS